MFCSLFYSWALLQMQIPIQVVPFVYSFFFVLTLASAFFTLTQGLVCLSVIGEGTHTLSLYSGKYSGIIHFFTSQRLKVHTDGMVKVPRIYFKLQWNFKDFVYTVCLKSDVPLRDLVVSKIYKVGCWKRCKLVKILIVTTSFVPYDLQNLDFLYPKCLSR